MAYSNSSLNTFTDCQAKYMHRYILKTKPEGVVSPHLTFGTMAHDVMYKAGRLRDESNDGVIEKGEYYSVIPSEILYDDLKQFFQIKSWNKYFTSVIKQVAQYEKELVSSLSGNITIEREVKIKLTEEELAYLGYKNIKDGLVGVIDLLILTETEAIIVDYKFSTSQKTQDDFDMDSQLPLYTFFVTASYGIPVRNIRVGYIDIPKIQFGEPTLLTNGTLSRAKDQNVSSELYEQAVIAIHGDDDPKYNCKPGGHYYDCYCNLALKKSAYMTMTYNDPDTYKNILSDVLLTAITISQLKELNMPFLRKYDSYSCKKCEYLSACKPWLTIWGGNE